MKKIQFLLLIFLVSGCYTIRTYDGRKVYKLFFTPSVKKEYCKNKETVLENAEYFYRKVFDKRKDYYLFKTMVREDSCCFYVHYYGYPSPEGFYRPKWMNNSEITLSKEKNRILNWR